ncbi:DNA repair protein RadC, partial [Weissella viridescens]
MNKVKSIEQLGRYLVGKYGTQPQEGCWIVAVDTQLTILDEYLVAMGTLNQVAIHPRDVYRHLIAINAYGFMMVHNHPSGNLTASTADEQVLQQFILCSEIMKI